MTNIRVAWGSNHVIITENPGPDSILIEGQEEILKTCNSLLRWLNEYHPGIFNDLPSLAKGKMLEDRMEKALDQ